ncbi:hypothetical protein GW17_00011347 [Ensete ventricosum]|nr:hypothetical protein GW17_00011347 [Ensete ventricosum]
MSSVRLVDTHPPKAEALNLIVLGNSDSVLLMHTVWKEIHQALPSSISLGKRRDVNFFREVHADLSAKWEEIGESEAEKEQMLVEIERECLEIYKRKVDEASKAKARLHQSVTAKEAEIAALVASLGEHTVHSMDQKKLQTLLLAEKEAAVFGSKPFPKRSNSLNRKPSGYGFNGKGNGFMTPVPRRLSAGSATPELLIPRSYSGRHSGCFKEMRRLSTTPLNFIVPPKDDSLSPFTSISGSESESPTLN